MQTGDSRTDPVTLRPVTRRSVLAVAAATAGALAGCSSVTDQEFEAQPVGLPEDGREELVLAESGQDSSTVTREVDAVDGEVTITSHTAAYARGPARGAPTLLEKFLGRVNDTEGAGAAAVARASDVGLEEVTFDPGSADYRFPGDRVSLVVPAGVRDGKAAVGKPGFFSLMYPPELTTNTVGSSTFAVDAKEFFPGLVYDRGRKYDPMKAWMPAGDYPAPDNFLSEGKVLVVLGDNSPEDVFGVPAAEMPGEKLGEDDWGSTNPFLMAAPSPVAEEIPPDLWTSGDTFDAGVPAWTGGATYGLGVLSTPAAQVAGKSANPVAGMSFEELLTSEQARGLLKQAGVTDADGVEWLAGPTPLADFDPGLEFLGDSPDGTTILDEETDLKSFLGVVSGEHGPWGVGVHMARVEADRDGDTDVVVAAGTHRWPVGSAEGVLSRDGERFTGILGSILDRARTLSAATGKRLRPITY